MCETCLAVLGHLHAPIRRGHTGTALLSLLGPGLVYFVYTELRVFMLLYLFLYILLCMFQLSCCVSNWSVLCIFVDFLHVDS